LLRTCDCYRVAAGGAASSGSQPDTASIYPATLPVN